MRTTYLLTAVLVIASLGLTAHAGNVTYLVNPVMFSNDTTLTGGFITTDGTLGLLTEANILDYKFVVAHPIYPYTFTPANPGADIGITGTILATASQILVPIDTDPSPSTANELVMIAYDNSLSECQNCLQSVLYGAVLTEPSNPPENVSLVGYAYMDSDRIPNLLPAVRYEPQQVIVIAEIPEPSSLILILSGLCLVAVRRRR